jgi:hypothetical protein
LKKELVEPYMHDPQINDFCPKKLVAPKKLLCVFALKKNVFVFMKSNRSQPKFCPIVPTSTHPMLRQKDTAVQELQPIVHKQFADLTVWG